MTTNMGAPPEALDAFLQTEYGRIAQQRGYVPALLAANRLPFPPTERLYMAMTLALMLEDERKL
jgi:hypothetical protein